MIENTTTNMNFYGDSKLAKGDMTSLAHFSATCDGNVVNLNINFSVVEYETHSEVINADFDDFKESVLAKINQ